MFMVIAQMQNMNIKASSLLLDTTSTDKRSYQYNKILLDRHQYFDDLRHSSSTVSGLNYTGLRNEFSHTRRSRS